jgi:hypothetical protein
MRCQRCGGTWGYRDEAGELICGLCGETQPQPVVDALRARWPVVVKEPVRKAAS